jgi:hypothetical protein
MKTILHGLLAVAMTTLIGCNQGTSGGPGANVPPSNNPLAGQADDTFSMSIPGVSLNQGESKTVVVAISRGKNFSEDVALTISGLPEGVTADPAQPIINRGATDVSIALAAANDAALGDFGVKVAGKPTMGVDAVSEWMVTITEKAPTGEEIARAEAAKVEAKAYTESMQTKYEEYEAKYEALQARAADAEGQAKADLDAQVIVAKAKLDAAGMKLAELKDADDTRWEKVKEGVGNAFDDLKNIFN